MLIREADFRTQFYDVVRGKHAVLVVGNDVDALNTACILMHLFSCDDTAFSVVPVSTWTSLDKILNDHGSSGSSNIILINCGGSRHLGELGLPINTTIFVIDSRRPFHIDNVYDDDQIRVLCFGREVDEELQIPAFDQVYREESDEDEDEEDEEEEDDDEGIDENRGARRRRNRLEDVEKKALKNEMRRRWERIKKDVLWEYNEKSWISIPSSFIALGVASEVSRASSEVVWLAEVALSSQFTQGIISIDGYTQSCLQYLQPYTTKFAPKGGTRADDLLRVKFDKELPLALYHHWSLYQAMKVNEYFACKTKNWNQKGDSEMKHLLAAIGLTLQECNQKFTAMTTERRSEVTALLEKEMGCKFASFFIHLGYSEKVSACDVARALSTWLGGPTVNSCDMKESSNLASQMTLDDRFLMCRTFMSSFLNGNVNTNLLHKMIIAAKSEMDSIWTLVANGINQSEIIPNGHFYLYSSNRPRDVCLSGPHSLFTFSRFLASAFSSMRRGRSAKPLVVSFPYHEMEGWHLIVGIMPLATDYSADDNKLKSFMGRAFEKISERPRIEIKRDFFDPNMVLVKSEDRGRFFDALQTILETVN